MARSLVCLLFFFFLYLLLLLKCSENNHQQLNVYWGRCACIFSVVFVLWRSKCDISAGWIFIRVCGFRICTFWRCEHSSHGFQSPQEATKGNVSDSRDIRKRNTIPPFATATLALLCVCVIHPTTIFNWGKVVFLLCAIIIIAGGDKASRHNAGYCLAGRNTSYLPLTPIYSLPQSPDIPKTPFYRLLVSRYLRSRRRVLSNKVRPDIPIRR